MIFEVIGSVHGKASSLVDAQIDNNLIRSIEKEGLPLSNFVRQRWCVHGVGEEHQTHQARSSVDGHLQVMTRWSSIDPRTSLPDPFRKAAKLERNVRGNGKLRHYYLRILSAG